MRILLVEDEAEMADALASALKRYDMVVDHVPTLAEAEEAISADVHAAVLLDRQLPDGDGLALIPKLRARAGGVPIIGLTARGELAARVAGLDGGADDYLAKPFDLPEFSARVRALLRRGRPDLCKLGALEWQWDTRQGTLGDRPLALSHHETVLIECLLRKAGRIVSKTVLANLIGHEGVAVDNKVEVYMHRLRKKLVQADLEIQNVRGLGYLIRAVEPSRT